MHNADNTLTLKFEQVSEQTTGYILRVSGLVKVRNLFPLIDAVDLDANPRSSKVGPVTDAIGASLETTPDTFPFKTKGILVGASAFERRERSRYELTFDDPRIEGILDGGHNTLALGLYVLRLALPDSPLIKKVRTWQDFKKLWADSRAAIADYRASLTPQDQELETLVPVELLLPSDPEDILVVTDFNGSLLDICAARNNNVQLKAEAKANQSGYFDEVKLLLPTDISSRIEWKTNEGGPVKSADLVALLWVALGMIDPMPVDDDGRQVEAPAPQNIYSGKGECVNRFERLMSSPEVSSMNTGQYKRELKNPLIHSALKIGAQFPELYDRIYAEFPDLYNANDGKFGRILAVKKMNGSKGKKFTKFTEREIETKIPEGYIIPLVYGLKALLKIEDGKVEWKTDPHKFLDQHLGAIVGQYKLIMAPWGYDPQKIGKASESYTQALNAFETQYLRSTASN
ncbi:hypothetical protein ADILRU_2347 [Leifsonia rubra CMS 76R]|nr:hypothetical protein ADILRU_2347 [Leifsonia rubra CMS 76R]